MNFFQSLFNAKANSRPLRKDKTPKTKRSRKRRPELEMLEDRCLLTCNVISGHVFYDINNNGLMEQGEQRLANTPVELRNAQNIIVGTAITDANGFYEFEDDDTISTAPQTLTRTLTFPTTQTNFSLSGLVGQFDPSLGQLISVEITNAGSITSDIRVENTSTSSPSTINATVGGKLTLTGPGNLSIQTNLTQNAGSYGASSYDGQLDFAGTSGKSFGNNTANGSQSVLLTGNNMAAFIGTGTVQLTQTAEVASTATGGGNVLVGVTSTGAAVVTVTYRYTPSNCLKPGTYTIIKTGDPSGYFDGKESRNGTVLGNPPGFSVIPLTLVGNDLINNDFGELRASSISGFVYGDIVQGGFNDGIKQAGEQGISGVTVRLDGTDELGAVHLTTTTDANGLYRFGNLRPGVYTITETQPSGWVDGKETIGTPGGGTGSDQFTNINLPANFDGVNNNFGEIRLGQLSGTVYADTSAGGYNNGVQEGSEQGLSGVTVQLNGLDYLNRPVTLVTTTNSSGQYQFSNLLPGTYVIVETQPAGYFDGKDSLGSLGGLPSNDQFANIGVLPGGSGTNYNFGELLASSLSGYVYGDIGQGGFNDGIKQVGELGISGVTVNLDGADESGAVHLTTTTDVNGFYKFSGLHPGVYTISQTQPSGWVDGKETIGTPGGVTGSDQFTNVNLPANFEGVNNNFGEIRLGQLSGKVFADTSAAGFNNGIQNTGEQGIAGVTIQLNGIDHLGRPLTLATTTDSSGNYLFTSLLPGTYTIVEIQPAGYIDGKDSLGSLSGVQTNDQFASIALAPGGSGANYNFAELVASSLSGYVYGDVGQGGFNDGIKQAGEQGIAGATITLDGNNDLGAVHLTTTTDANGFYRFGNLRPGFYTITESQPSGWSDGRETIGTPGGITLNDIFTNLNLLPAFDGVNNNFGEIRLGQLSGTVYSDSSPAGFNNGIQGIGEQGIAGVTVTLTGVDHAGNPVAVSVTTDGAGRYAFNNLLPGTYTITETQAANYLDGKDAVGALGGLTNINDQFSNIVLPGGGSGPNYNFGELVPSTISGYVYLDTGNGGFNDGIKQANELGIAGVLVTLTGINDLTSVNFQQRTDANGFYSFNGLRPGVYTLTESQPEGFIDGKDSIGVYGGQTGNDVFISISLPVAAHDYNNNFGELKPVILISHDPEIPEDVSPEPPIFITPAISITTKGQLLASTVNTSDAAISADSRFINSVYTSLLGRTAEESGLAGWLGFLRSNGNRRAVVDGIWNSTEHRNRQIINLYQTFIGTNPDQGTLNFYATQFRNGASEFDVAALIAGSPQTTALFPATSDYVIKLFDVALGRSPDANELAAWSSFGGDRTALARSILTSNEALGLVAQRCFLQLLNRPASSAEVAGRVAQLKLGSAGFNNFIADIFTSAEFASHLGA